MTGSYYIAIDIGGTRIKLGILKNDILLDTIIFDANAEKGLLHHLKIFANKINQLLHQFDAVNSLGGIGIAFAGLVNSTTKKILSTNGKYNDGPNIDIEEWVTENWQVPLFIDNDARMAAVAEWQYGAGKGSNDIVAVTIGTGIGTSAIIEGKLLRGKHHQAGCLGGHFTIKFDGKICNCGNIGCAEAYASTWSIVERIKNDPLFNQSALSKVSPVDFYHLFKAAKENDALAIRFKNECLDIWAALIVNLIHAYDPEIIVLGGGILNSKDEIIPYLTKRVHQYAWTPWGKVQIKSSELINDAAVYGLNYCLQHEI